MLEAYGRQVALLVFVGLCETAIAHFSLSWLMRPRRRGGLYAVLLLVYFSATIFDAANDFEAYYVFLIAYILIAIIAFFFYEGPLAMRLAIPFVCLAFDYAATIISCLLVWVYNGPDIAEFPANLQPGFASQTLLTAMCLAGMWGISVFGRRMRRDTSPVFMRAVSFVTEFVMPLAILLLLIRQFYVNQMPRDIPMEIEGHILVALLLVLSACTLYSLTRANSVLSASLSYSSTLEQMLSVQKKYYTNLQQHQLELRRLNHDIKSHTRVISELLEQGHTEEAAEYLHLLQDSVASIATPVTTCDNQLVAALLNDKLAEPKKNGVELTLCVMVPPVLRINNVDVSIVLGNLLDNAVEACAAMGTGTRRFIDVDMQLEGMFLTIDVSNSYDGLVRQQGDKYLTTKGDGRSRGIGLSNVRRAVQRHDGRLTVTHDGSVFRVIAIMKYPVA